MNFEQVFAREVFCVAGLPFDAVSLTNTVDKIADSISKNEKLFLSTPNLNWLRTASENAEFRTSVLLSDLSIADGMPVVLLAQLLSIPIKQRVAGSDLIVALSRTIRIKTFFFGGDQNSAEIAVQKINESDLPMRAVGGINPGYGNIDDMSARSLIESINNCSPDFVIVSLGAVRGQAWIVRNRHLLNASVISHLGAVVNFFAGTVKRAPLLMQRLCLEWVWRIYQEPKLASRYFKDAIFLGKYLLFKSTAHKFFQFKNRSGTPGHISLSTLDTSVRVALTGSFGQANINDVRKTFINALRIHTPIVIDMQNCEYFDAQFLGALLLLKKCCLETGRTLSISDTNRKVKRLFYCSNAEYLLDDNQNVTRKLNSPDR